MGWLNGRSKIVKCGLKNVTAGSVEEGLARVLFAYCITSQSNTGMTPDELLLKCKIRTRLDLLRPNSLQRVEASSCRSRIMIPQQDRVSSLWVI